LYVKPFKMALFSAHIWGEPFDVELNKNNMQTTPHWSPFSPTINFLH